MELKSVLMDPSKNMRPYQTDIYNKSSDSLLKALPKDLKDEHNAFLDFFNTPADGISHLIEPSRADDIGDIIRSVFNSSVASSSAPSTTYHQDESSIRSADAMKGFLSPHLTPSIFDLDSDSDEVEVI